MKLASKQNRFGHRFWPIGALVAAFIAAVAGHIALLWWGLGSPQVSGDGVWSASWARLRHATAVRTVRVPVSRAGQRAAAVAVPLVHAPYMATAAEPTPTPQPADHVLAEEAQAEGWGSVAKAGAVADGEPSPAQYWSDTQVDTLPTPVDSWALDESQIPVAGAWQITVQVWVSASGRIDHVTLLGASPPGEWALRAIAPLAQTEMAPALLAGQAVPSVIAFQIF